MQQALVISVLIINVPRLGCAKTIQLVAIYIYTRVFKVVKGKCNVGQY